MYNKIIQKTHHEIRIPERDVSACYLFTYLRLSIVSTEPELVMSFLFIFIVLSLPQCTP